MKRKKRNCTQKLHKLLHSKSEQRNENAQTLDQKPIPAIDDLLANFISSDELWALIKAEEDSRELK